MKLKTKTVSIILGATILSGLLIGYFTAIKNTVNANEPSSREFKNGEVVVEPAIEIEPIVVDKIPEVVDIVSNITHPIEEYNSSNTIYKDDDIQIYTTRLYKLSHNMDRTGLELIFKNTSDHEIVVRLDNTVVNGYNVVGLLAVGVEPGQTMMATATLIDRDLNPLGIDTVDKIDTLDLRFELRTDDIDDNKLGKITKECHIRNTTSQSLAPVDTTKFIMVHNEDGLDIGVGYLPVHTNEQEYYENGQELTIYLSNRLKDDTKDIRVEAVDIKVNNNLTGIGLEARAMSGERCIRRALFTEQYLGTSRSIKGSKVSFKLNIIDNRTNKVLDTTEQYTATLK